MENTNQNPVFKFRAESQNDVNLVLLAIGIDNILFYRTTLAENSFPDVCITLQLAGMDMETLKDVMRDVEDSHVMIETLRLSEEYTGERSYEVTDWEPPTERRVNVFKFISAYQADVDRLFNALPPLTAIALDHLPVMSFHGKHSILHTLTVQGVELADILNIIDNLDGLDPEIRRTIGDPGDVDITIE